MLALLSTVLAIPHNLEPVLVEGGDRIGEFLVLLVALNNIIDGSLSLHVEETNASIVSGLSVCDISLVFIVCRNELIVAIGLQLLKLGSEVSLNFFNFGLELSILFFESCLVTGLQFSNSLPIGIYDLLKDLLDVIVVLSNLRKRSLNTLINEAVISSILHDEINKIFNLSASSVVLWILLV